MKMLKKYLMVLFVMAIFAVLIACDSTSKPVVFNDLNAITEHLDKSRDGTIEKPITLIVDIPLGDMTNSGSGWQRLLMIIENAGKNVALDLSACQMTNTEFNPFNDVSSGKFFIVSIVLPDEAKSIIGLRDVSSFLHFYNLKTISASEVTSIGRNAFKDIISLKTADFPVVASIAEGVFNGCTGLENVNLPLVTSIGNEAFKNCSSLKSLNIPLATTIGESAFDDCSSMNSISFPASATITNNPFLGADSLVSFSLIGSGDLSAIEDGKALVRNNTELISYPSASGNITMENIITIGRSAFNGNTNLTSVSFPAATTIGIRAFRSCTSLINASFSEVTTIGLGAFENTGTTALVITLGERAPSLGGGTFTGVTEAKPVTVKVPFGATGYGQSPTNTTTNNWGNRFRGGVWERYETWWGDVEYERRVVPNTNIELTIEFMAE